MLTKRKQPLGEEPREFIRYRRLVKVNWFGLLAFLIYLGALGFYLWVGMRKAQTKHVICMPCSNIVPASHFIPTAFRISLYALM